MHSDAKSSASSAPSKPYATVLTLLIALCTIACSPLKQTQTDTVRTADTVRILTTRTDTVIRLAPDTATLAALAECDETGQVLINTIRTLQGSRVSVAPQVAYRLVPDTTGRVRRVAYLHLMAVADSLRQSVTTLQTDCYTARRQVRSLQEQTRRSRPSWALILFVFGAGALAGTALGLRLAARITGRQ